MYAFAPDKGVSIFGKFIFKQINHGWRRAFLELRWRLNVQPNPASDKDRDRAIRTHSARGLARINCLHVIRYNIVHLSAQIPQSKPMA